MKDFKNKTKSELVSILSSKRNALKDFRFGIAGSKVRNVKEGKALKKDIARVLTLINTSR